MSQPFGRAFFFLFLFSAFGHAQTTWYVDQGGAGDFVGIQQGISDFRVVPGDTVIVRDGIYFENIDFSGKGIYLRSENGPAITVINGGGVAQNFGGVVSIRFVNGNRATLEGFTITNGSAGLGGGIFIEKALATVRSCIIRDNQATSGFPNGRGGGIYCAQSSPLMENCRIEQNSADEGGGIYFSSCPLSGNLERPRLSRCIVAGNSSLGFFPGGGGVASELSSPEFFDCTFSGNSSFSWGGAVSLDGYNVTGNSPEFSNCLFTNNSALFEGAGAYILDCEPTFSHCTFVNHPNEAIYVDYSDAIFFNCVVWGNGAGIVGSIFGGYAIVSYSDIQGGVWGGPGNISENPIFMVSANGAYFLSQIDAGQAQNSPCLNTGDSAPNYVVGTTRTDGKLDRATTDMGYHYPYSGPIVELTNLVAQEDVLLEVSQCTPNKKVLVAWSTAGAGPFNTPFGLAYVGTPYRIIHLTADGVGYASFNQHIPAGTAGVQIWLQSADIGKSVLSNPITLTIQ